MAQSAAPVEINIAAQPLGQALNELALQAKLQLLVAPDLVAGKTAPAVSGSLVPAEALRRLLAGSGLDAVAQGQSTVVRRAPPLTPVPAATALPEVRVRGGAERPSASAPVIGYKAETSEALGFDLTAQELPATVNVITADFLRDTGARKLTDIIAYIPGVSYDETAGTNKDNFIVRGFAVGSTLVNGIRQIYNDQRRVLDTIERVEVIKGADGVESAAADPGGSINIITRKPQPEFGAELAVAAGQFGYRKFSGDVTGAMTSDGAVQGRLIASYEKGGLWRPTGPESDRTVALAPSLTWDYAPGSHAIFEYQYTEASTKFDRGVAYLPGAFPGGFAPRDWSQNTDYDFGPTKSQRFEIDINHRFDSVWSARLHAQRYTSRYGPLGQLEGLIGDSGVYADDGLTWNGSKRVIDKFQYGLYSGESLTKAYSGELKAAFDVGSTRHETIGGVSLTDASQAYARLDSRDVMLTTDLFHPDNHLRPGLPGDPVPGFSGDNTETVRSFYGQWLARWTPGWRTVVGVRHDDIELTGRFRGTPADPFEATGYGNTSVSYRLATSFDLAPQHSLFAGYSDAHFPQDAFTRSGEALDPVGNIGYEVGLKSSLLDGRLLWTNSVFRNSQTDLAAADPRNSPAESFSILFGNVRVQGFESQLSGKVTADLDVTAGVSLQRAEVTKSEGGALDGKRFKNTPRRSLSLFANYRWASFGLPQLSTRLGVNNVGDRDGNDENTFKLPAYTRVDAGLTWRFDTHLTLDLNIENVFDKTYYTSADGGGLGGGVVGIGNRQLANATLRYAF